VQSRGDSDTLALPAGTKSVQEPEASVGSSTVAVEELMIWIFILTARNQI